jgi:hypothetical protein
MVAAKAALRAALYQSGLELEQATFGRTIFDRLVADGRAQRAR